MRLAQDAPCGHKRGRHVGTPGHEYVPRHACTSGADGRWSYGMLSSGEGAASAALSPLLSQCAQAGTLARPPISPPSSRPPSWHPAASLRAAPASRVGGRHRGVGGAGAHVRGGLMVARVGVGATPCKAQPLAATQARTEAPAHPNLPHLHQRLGRPHALERAEQAHHVCCALNGLQRGQEGWQEPGVHLAVVHRQVPSWAGWVRGRGPRSSAGQCKRREQAGATSGAGKRT